MRPVVASAELALPREVLYERLADLREHWSLAGRWIEPLALQEDGGVVRLRGPLGLRRTVQTSLHERVATERLAGEARVGATVAAIAWTLEASGPSSTRVTLRAELVRATPADRLLLALGGHRWLRAQFAGTLARLAGVGSTAR